MRKLFTLFLFACTSIFSHAQSLEFQLNGNKVEDGTTLTFKSTETVIIPNVLSNWAAKAKGLTLVNKTSNPITCNVEANIIDNTLDVIGALCIGSTCQDFEKSFSKSITIPANGIEDMSQTKTGNMKKTSPAGMMVMRIDVFAGLESHSLTLHFIHEDPTGIDDIRNNGGVVDVYNVAGNLVKSNYDVNNIKNLAHGLYIIRGKNTKAYKIVVK